MTREHAAALRPWTKRRSCFLLGALCLACHLASCSIQQTYAVGQSVSQSVSQAVGQAWQRNECFKINDAQERSRCLASTSASYQEYERRSR